MAKDIFSVSKCHQSRTVRLSLEVREANKIPDVPGVMVAWMYALQLEWSMILSMMDENQDDASAEWSFPQAGGPSLLSAKGGPTIFPGALCKTRFAFSSTWFACSSLLPSHGAPSGRKNCPADFTRSQHKKWASAGGSFMFCWVCPEEKILRPGARNGGFAFLFHELDEEDVAGQDRFFLRLWASLSAKVTAIKAHKTSQVPARGIHGIPNSLVLPSGGGSASDLETYGGKPTALL